MYKKFSEQLQKPLQKKFIQEQSDILYAKILNIISNNGSINDIHNFLKTENIVLNNLYLM
jgi:hypothetical protein